MKLFKNLFGKKETGVPTMENPPVPPLEEIAKAAKKYAEDSTESQCKQILKHLQAGKSLTAIQALNLFGCWRCAARISDLRHDGNNIKTTMTEGKKRYAIYNLIQ